MHYKASVKFNSGSKDLRSFLRESGFIIYRVDLTGVSAYDGVDDPEGIPHYYDGYHNSDKPLPEKVIKRLDEELDKGLVTKIQITKTK